MNEVKTLVSVVTVVYNDVFNIERTILSVINQTYKNIEYIIIDGGSTDGTVDIIKKYSDRVAYWVSEPDKGILFAMNKGIDRATGEWINFMNSGDYFFNDTVFEKVFSSTHPTADFLYGSFITKFGGLKVRVVPSDNVNSMAWQGMPLCHNTLFAKTTLMKKFPFDTKFKVSSDGDFVIRCAAAGRVFERVDQIIFRVGEQGQGFSAAHWMKARVENWRIARTYFPGMRTDFFHFQGLLRELIFRTFKKITSIVGLYQMIRFVYRKKIQNKIPLLPPNCFPFEG